jgi:carbon monoxide dehydrogenase subunit G
MKINNQFTINSKKDDVWNFFMDAEKIAKCVPGCKEITMISPTRYDSVLDVKIQFMTITFKTRGELLKAIDKERIIVEMNGKSVGFGLFQNKLTVNLMDIETNETLVDYEMDIQVTGRLASLGKVFMKGSITKSSEEFAENVQSLFQHS